MKLEELKPIREKILDDNEKQMLLLKKQRESLTAIPKPTGLPEKAEGPWIEFFEV